MADGLVRAAVRHNAYVDSVTLLQVSSDLLAVAGVLDAGLVMGTELNLDVLREAGLLVESTAAAGPNDLVIAVRASDHASATSAIERAEALLAGRRARRAGGDPLAAAPPRSLRSAHRADPLANLALVSVPGPFAAGEARQALVDGLHVFLFSDNVSIEDEIELKRLARTSDLLMMGPDCGTAILNGVGLGFANVVRRGDIGLIGASGTGLQEVTSLLHQAGQGISQAIGTGGRDLSSRVGGITTLQAIELLSADPETRVIVLVGKPPAPEVASHVLLAAAATGKPVIACLLAPPPPLLDPGVEEPGAAMSPSNLQIAGTLYEAARMAAPAGQWSGELSENMPRPRLREGQRQIRGLFCGGTLRAEAMLALAPLDNARGDEFIDFGDDRYTRGRAHPMIDPSLRNRAIVESGADPRVAVVLLDVILGLGAHADPAGAAVPAISQALARAQTDGRQLAVIAHVVGTDRDPQSLRAQEAVLRAAGVHVPGSNYHAATAAGLLVEAAAA